MYDRENVGWKMVYNFLGIDEKTKRNLLTFDQNIGAVYLNIRSVYPNKNHVTTHPVTLRRRKQVFGTLLLGPSIHGLVTEKYKSQDQRIKICKYKHKNWITRLL